MVNQSGVNEYNKLLTGGSEYRWPLFHASYYFCDSHYHGGIDVINYRWLSLAFILFVTSVMCERID